jgi:hypothetical protein
MGTVVASCSGQRRRQTPDDSDDDNPPKNETRGENILKVWSMPFLADDPEQTSKQEQDS